MSTISRSSLSIKIIGPRSWSKQAGGWSLTERQSYFIIFHILHANRLIFERVLLHINFLDLYIWGFRDVGF